MRLTGLVLKDFRNIEDLKLEELLGCTVFVGDNAQGKTNILEAIFFAASGASFRTSREEYVIKKNSEGAYIYVDLLNEEGISHTIRLVWQKTDDGITKTIQIDGTNKTKGDLINIFPAVIFSPEDIDLLRLSPSHRRRFLDLMIGRHDVEYRADIAEFTRIRRQRNQLLLLIKQNRVGEEELNIWDEKISETGARIVARREEAINAIKQIVADEYSRLAHNHNNKTLEIKYDPSLGVKTQRDYLNELQKNRPLDIARASTTLGIHRDDLKFILDGQDVRYSASRGEFRSVVLALKLAEAKYIEQMTKEKPVFLLDDAFSELDEGRKISLAKEVEGYQTFITTNSKKTSEFFVDPKIFNIEAGKIAIASGR